jgi:hypothetical protein
VVVKCIHLILIFLCLLKLRQHNLSCIYMFKIIMESADLVSTFFLKKKDLEVEEECNLLDAFAETKIITKKCLTRNLAFSIAEASQ